MANISRGLYLNGGNSLMDELKVFTGNAHPALAQAVCEYLNIPLGKCEVFEFSNENIFVRILDNVRQRHFCYSAHLLPGQ